MPCGKLKLRLKNGAGFSKSFLLQCFMLMKALASKIALTRANNLIMHL